MNRLVCVALLALSGLAFATPVAAAYLVIATAGVSVGSPSCSDSENTGALAAPRASASAPDCFPGASAASFADLPTASVGVYAFADSTPQSFAVASAEAEFQDVVHFQVPSALDGQPFVLDVEFVVDGVITQDAVPTVTALLTSRCILSDQGTFEFYDGQLIDTLPVSGVRTIPGTLTITPPNYAMNVSMHMRAPGLTEGTVDFLSTGTLRMTTPPGVTYTSDSGVFQAPEPGAAAIGAVACAALVMRQRRYAPAAT